MIIARLFNTVGPRQTVRYGMVIPNFVRQALLANPSPSMRRDPDPVVHYVGDVVNGLLGRCRRPRAIGQFFISGTTKRSLDSRSRETREAAAKKPVRDPAHHLRPGLRAGFEECRAVCAGSEEIKI